LIEIKEIKPNHLDAYAKIPISFTVSSILHVKLLHNGMGGILLSEENIENPYIKDYDNTPEGGPTEWSSHFDIKNWGFFLAIENLIPIAGAAVAYNTNGVNMLEERDDLSVLWDIRVRPEKRGFGVGKALFKRACEWSATCGCRQMKIETQNINTPACHFYRNMGCNLGVIHRFAYYRDPNITHEIMLNWYIDL
jgi:streptothricin acetyltransferase